MRPELESSYPNWDDLTNAGIIRPVFFVYVDFGSVSLDPITAVYDDGFGWSPDGKLLDLTFPTDSIDIRNRSQFTLTFTGLDSTILTSVLNARHDLQFPTSSYDVPSASVDLWFFLDDGTIDTDASYIVTGGLMDTAEIRHTPAGTVCVMTFQCSMNWNWDRPLGGRYTDTYQKSRTAQAYNPAISAANFAADDGFKFVEALQNWTLFWGKPQPAKNPGKVVKEKKPPARNKRPSR
jgi:hypothetical protein